MPTTQTEVAAPPAPSAPARAEASTEANASPPAASGSNAPHPAASPPADATASAHAAAAAATAKRAAAAAKAASGAPSDPPSGDRSDPSGPTPELKSIPTAILNTEGGRFAIQLVDALPGNVALCIQVRAGSSVDDVLGGLMWARGMWISEQMPSSREDFDRRWPIGNDGREVRRDVRMAVELGAADMPAPEVPRQPARWERHGARDTIGAIEEAQRNTVWAEIEREREAEEQEQAGEAALGSEAAGGGAAVGEGGAEAVDGKREGAPAPLGNETAEATLANGSRRSRTRQRE